MKISVKNFLRYLDLRKMKVKLYEPFKKWYHGGTIWLIGDTHFQKNGEMEKTFGWPSAEERLEIINSKVTKNDTFICLGDVGDRLDLVSKIKCNYKVLITGNHDAGNTNYKRRVLDCGICNTEEEAKSICKSGLMYTYSIGNVRPDGYISIGDPDNERFILRKDNRLFDEVYDGPLFVNNKIVLSHERVELPFAINIHGHEHCGVFATEKQIVTQDGTYTTYLINLASDVVNFVPYRLDRIIGQFPLKYIKSIHDITIETAGRNNVDV